jgi:hypothetical protein
LQKNAPSVDFQASGAQKPKIGVWRKSHKHCLVRPVAPVLAAGTSISAFPQAGVTKFVPQDAGFLR